jgi:hypothetical protein
MMNPWQYTVGEGVQETPYWVVVWQTSESPEVHGLYRDEREALAAAHAYWRDHRGGPAGGFDMGGMDEFMAIYPETEAVWIVPMGKPGPLVLTPVEKS